MKTMYEETDFSALRTREELIRRRVEKREAIVRKRRIRTTKVVAISFGIGMIAVHLIDPNYVVAGGAIYACLPGE